MRFEWDHAKNHHNLSKHKISFETAALVFDDPGILSLQERGVDDAVLVVVAHTYRDTPGGEVVRIIPARKATPAERRQNEESAKR